MSRQQKIVDLYILYHNFSPSLPLLSLSSLCLSLQKNDFSEDVLDVTQHGKYKDRADIRFESVVLSISYCHFCFYLLVIIGLVSFVLFHRTCTKLYNNQVHKVLRQVF